MHIVNVQSKLNVCFSILYIFLNHLNISTVIIHTFMCVFIEFKALCVLTLTINYILPSRAKAKNERCYPSGSPVCHLALDLDCFTFFA
jgi:hypothetical protein